MKINKKEHGFSVIELLAVIVLLSLIVGIVFYVVNNVMNISKEKSYQVTVNNIENQAEGYVLENNNLLFVLSDDDSNIEYQCVSVKELIDFGYFKNDILESKINDDRNVKLDDYVYIERNIDTKTLIKKELLIDGGTVCTNLLEAKGFVNIVVLPEEYSGYKEITLKYQLKNVANLDDYVFGYSYSNDSFEIISDTGSVKKLKVTDNGMVTRYIKKKNGETIVTKTKDVVNIDNIPPVIETSDIKRVYGSFFGLYDGVTISDNSGIETVDSVIFDGVEIKDTNSLNAGENILIYKSVDKVGNVSSASRVITLIVGDKTYDYKEEEQIHDVQADGVYIIEAYGAQGGNSGGYGGYVKAEVSLKNGDKLYINTGGINGYNGGGGYQNSSYYPGGGATTVKYNDELILISAGGGATGGTGIGGIGGEGTGIGGENVGAGAGLSGINGSGGSSSPNYDYQCNCQKCGGGCKQTNPTYQCCKENYFTEDKAVCKKWGTCGGECTAYWGTYNCNCSTCTTQGKSGIGGSNTVNSPALSIEKLSGKRNGNGYVIIKYKAEE